MNRSMTNRNFVESRGSGRGGDGYRGGRGGDGYRGGRGGDGYRGGRGGDGYRGGRGGDGYRGGRGGDGYRGGRGGDGYRGGRGGDGYRGGRGGGGGRGQAMPISAPPGPFEARCNLFTMTLNTKVAKSMKLYSHRVEMAYENNRFKKIIEEIKRHTMTRWLVEEGGDFYSLYDGDALFISTKKFTDVLECGRNISMNIQFTNEIPVHDQQGNYSAEWIQALQLFVNTAAGDLGWNQLMRSRFFYDDSASWKSHCFDDPFDLWYGCRQHIMQYIDSHGVRKMALSRDVVGMMGCKKMTLMDFIMQATGCSISTRFNTVKQAKAFLTTNINKINAIIAKKRINILTTHLGNTRRHKVKCLSEFLADDTATRFPYLGRDLTVYEYFKSKYELQGVKSYDLLVNVGSNMKPTYLPVCVCTVPAQVFRNNSIAESEILKQAMVLTPAQRIHQTTEMIQKISLNDATPLHIKTSKDWTIVKGEVLPPPSMKYSKAVAVESGASWNLRGVSFLKPKGAFRCGFIYISPAASIKEDFLRQCQRYGLRPQVADEISLSQNYRGFGTDAFYSSKELTQACQKLFGKGSIDLAVIFIPLKYPQVVKDKLKSITDAFFTSQCICVQSVEQNRSPDKYWGNVLLKVNVKLNGRNVCLNPDLTNPCYKVFRDVIGTDNSTLVIGGDVTGAIKQFVASRKKQGIQKPPNRVIYVRDGVSESQMGAILSEEIPYLRAALAENSNKNSPPKLFVIVAVKRQGKRFFAKTSDVSPPAGFCVLNDLIDIGPYSNFFLQPHSGRIGCLIAPRYFVLVNEFDLSKMESALLMNAFCYLWSRATGAISIPAPVKCADVFASRMRGTLRKKLKIYIYLFFINNISFYISV
ncbi:argonaute AGO [Cardiosporidium cionae]|uniref:Argonaute AGO n=1 Tax=Cardiosporidium cionae TaxID=476202 RepID=A0ABQ7J4M8_9APIC|nr:argonaute AGO [Cardiosporidium cionae]|eukprot:KAF8818141.1 argonaute AGO [Cardiosporidium cionae]